MGGRTVAVVQLRITKMVLSHRLVTMATRPSSLRGSLSLISSKIFANSSLPFSARPLSTSNWQHIKTERCGTDDRVGLVALNRPKALNALCGPLMEELTQALDEWDKDPSIGAMVLTGNEKAFAAGADIFWNKGPKRRDDCLRGEEEGKLGTQIVFFSKSNLIFKCSSIKSGSN